MGKSHDRQRIADFHDVIDRDLHIINAGFGDSDLLEDDDGGGIALGILHMKFDLAFLEDTDLVRGEEPQGADELADAGGPPVERAECGEDYRKLRQDQAVQNANQKEVAIGFAADLLAHEGTLQVWEDA